MKSGADFEKYNGDIVLGAHPLAEIELKCKVIKIGIGEFIENTNTRNLWA